MDPSFRAKRVEQASRTGIGERMALALRCATLALPLRCQMVVRPLHCTEIKRSVELYALGALADNAAEEIIRHIEDCSICGAIVAKAQEIAQLLRLAVPQVEPSAALRSRVLAAARE